MTQLAAAQAVAHVLARQHLREDAPATDVVQTARDLVGLHATVAPSPYLQLFTRMPGFTRPVLEHELYERRSLARVRCMRGTLFLLPLDLLPIAWAATRELVLGPSTKYLIAQGLTLVSYERWASRVDAVLAQRTRLRGPQPPGDLFAGVPADHPLLQSDPRRPLDPNLEMIASYIAPDDVVIDVGGGAGRVSLPLALRCREVINVEPSGAMGAGFTANATQAGITNVRVIVSDWLTSAPPVGTVALVNHVTYLTREIGPFIEKLEQVGRRRVLITVNSPPSPSRRPPPTCRSRPPWSPGADRPRGAVPAGPRRPP